MALALAMQYALEPLSRAHRGKVPPLKCAAHHNEHRMRRWHFAGVLVTKTVAAGLEKAEQHMSEPQKFPLVFVGLKVIYAARPTCLHVRGSKTTRALHGIAFRRIVPRDARAKAHMGAHTHCACSPNTFPSQSHVSWVNFVVAFKKKWA